MPKTIKWYGVLKQYKANEWIKGHDIFDSHFGSQWTCELTNMWNQYELKQMN